MDPNETLFHANGVSITRSLLRLGGMTFAVANIAAMGRKDKPSGALMWWAFGLAAAAFTVLGFVGGVQDGMSTADATAGSSCCGFIAVVLLLVAATRNSSYSILFTLNNGSVHTWSTRSRELRDNVFASIERAMER